MADIICPICETPNEPDATHCMVCGERLTPAAEGEEISPEENVSAMVDAEAQEGQEARQAQDEAQALAEESDAADLEAFDQELEAEPPAALYSPVDGTAYPQGSPEYEEGFGPMGEELVAEPPAGLEEGEPGELGDDGTAAEEQDFILEEIDGEEEAGADEEGGFEGVDEEFAADEDAYDDVQGEIGEEISAAAEEAQEEQQGPSERFRQAFAAKRKERSASAPLPTPGVLAESATLTLYHERQPVLTHEIDTDETLIGRRDPISDTYPDLDVEAWDQGSHISRKHAYVYRQNRNYTLYVVSNAGTQLNDELLDLGDRRKLSHGDVIVLAGAIALKFELPEDQQTVVPAQQTGGGEAAAASEPQEIEPEFEPVEGSEPQEIEPEFEPVEEHDEYDEYDELEVEPVTPGMNADELEPLEDDYMADDELE